MPALPEPIASLVSALSQLPGIGVFPATIDENARRVSTSLAYLTPTVRARENLTIRTGTDGWMSVCSSACRSASRWAWGSA